MRWSREGGGIWGGWRDVRGEVRWRVEEGGVGGERLAGVGIGSRLLSLAAAMAPGKRSSPKKAVEGTPKKPRSQTPEAIIAQKLRDKFKGMGQGETDVTKGPDGKHYARSSSRTTLQRKAELVTSLLDGFIMTA